MLLDLYAAFDANLIMRYLESRMMLKSILLLLLLFATWQLAIALYHFVRGEQNEKEKMVVALAWRVGLSVFVFVVIMIAFGLGFITPANSIHYLYDQEMVTPKR